MQRCAPNGPTGAGLEASPNELGLNNNFQLKNVETFDFFASLRSVMRDLSADSGYESKGWRVIRDISDNVVLNTEDWVRTRIVLLFQSCAATASAQH